MTEFPPLESSRLGALAAALLLVAAAGCGALPGADPGNETAPNGTDNPDDRPNESYFVHEGERLTVESAAEQEITGHVNESLSVERVTVRLRSDDAANPFLRSVDANVSADGSFAVGVGLSQVDGGTNFTATLLNGSETLTEAEGKIVNGTA